MSKDFEYLQTHLNQQVRGLIWVTKEPLNELPRPFKALDYFMNGLLLKSESLGPDKDSKNLFCTQHFGKNFFMGHLLSVDQNLDKNIVSLMSWVKTQLEDGDKVFVLDMSGKKVTQALQKKYPKLAFENLELP